MEQLNKLLDCVTKEEDRYYELADQEMNRGNVFGNQMMAAQATAFQRVRYAIESMLEENV